MRLTIATIFRAESCGSEGNSRRSVWPPTSNFTCVPPTSTVRMRRTLFLRAFFMTLILSRRRGAVDEPAQRAQRLDARRRQHAVPGPRSLHHIALFRAGREENRLARALERRKRERDARFGSGADDGDNPAPRLIERRLIRKQRRGVTVLA